MRRMEQWEASKLAYELGLVGEHNHIFTELMVGEPVNVTTENPPYESKFEPQSFTVTPKYDLGLYYYEITKPPAKRPLRQPVLSINEVAAWAKCLRLDYST